MRKFIVKHFALSYNIKIGDNYISALRASRIIFPLFVITGLLITYTGYNFLSILTLSLTIISLFIGFVYFRIWPVEWRELDKSQKIQTAEALFTGRTSMVLSKEEYEEAKLLYIK